VILALRLSRPPDTKTRPLAAAKPNCDTATGMGVKGRQPSLRKSYCSKKLRKPWPTLPLITNSLPSISAATACGTAVGRPAPRRHSADTGDSDSAKAQARAIIGRIDFPFFTSINVTSNYSKNMVAKPRKAKKPITSVTVVTKTLEAMAGSISAR